MSGFSSGRVKGNITSILIEDELVKVSLSLYDTDGMEGLYVPNSQFRETSKDVASGAVSGESEHEYRQLRQQSLAMGNASRYECLPENEQCHRQSYQKK